jgi:hypothetical protein
MTAWEMNCVYSLADSKRPRRGQSTEPEGTTMSGSTPVPAAETPHANGRASPGTSSGTTDGPSNGLRAARRIATIAILAATAVQIAVWVAISVATASIEAPWWLWTVLAGALVIGVLRLLESPRPQLLNRAATPAPADASTENEQQR